MKKLKFIAFSLAVATGAAAGDFTTYVDPFIGTGAAEGGLSGNTYPGATVPFGMVQLSPDTHTAPDWFNASGYSYNDNRIYGFTHTHLSGTGACDLIDISLFPITGESVSSAFSLLHCIIKGFPDMSTTIIGFPVAFNDLSKSDCRPGNSREERSKPSPAVDLSGERPRNVERVPTAAMTKSLFSAAFTASFMPLPS